LWPQLVPPLQSLWQEVMSAAGRDPTGVDSHDRGRPELRTYAPLDLNPFCNKRKLTDVTCRTMSWHHQTDLEEWWIGPGQRNSARLGHGVDRAAPGCGPPTPACTTKRLAARHLTEDGCAETADHSSTRRRRSGPARQTRGTDRRPISPLVGRLPARFGRAEPAGEHPRACSRVPH